MNSLHSRSRALVIVIDRPTEYRAERRHGDPGNCSNLDGGNFSLLYVSRDRFDADFECARGLFFCPEYVSGVIDIFFKFHLFIRLIVDICNSRCCPRVTLA